MPTRTYLSDNLTPHLSGYDGWEERWIEAFASHAERRFETRALVNASIHGGDPVPLAYIFALHGGGLVLVVAAEEEGEGDHGDHEAAANAAARVERELWSRMRGAGQHEIWISSPDQAAFHVVRPEEGAFSTGFGRLGMSRTPDLILPRTTVTPVRKLHHDHF